MHFYIRTYRIGRFRLSECSGACPSETTFTMPSADRTFIPATSYGIRAPVLFHSIIARPCAKKPVAPTSPNPRVGSCGRRDHGETSYG